MNDQTLPQTGRLRRDFLNELTLATLPGYTPDRELIARMRQTADELRKAVEESRRVLGLETDSDG